MKKRASILHLPFQFTSYVYKHKALITIGLFVFYMIFFDKFNIRSQIKIYRNLSELKDKKLEYQHMIVQAKADKLDLEQNFEKFAREKYHMSRKDEDVFIIETRKKKN
jgi:cell division protein FtsB